MISQTSDSGTRAAAEAQSTAEDGKIQEHLSEEVKHELSLKRKKRI